MRGPGFRENAPGKRFIIRQEEGKGQGGLVTLRNVSTHQLGLLEGVLSYRPKSDLPLNSERKRV